MTGVGVGMGTDAEAEGFVAASAGAAEGTGGFVVASPAVDVAADTDPDADPGTVGFVFALAPAAVAGGFVPPTPAACLPAFTP